MGLLRTMSGRLLAVIVAMLVLAALVLTFAGGSDAKTATLHFDRTVSIYPGSDIRVMGVRIGEVTSVVPEGDSVKVGVEYDAKYRLPAGAKAAIVTPTLVADRFIQIAPAYSKGPVLADGGEIALADSATPVELDQIYQSISDITQALGPNGVNKDGSLNTLLQAGADALRGNGQLANQTITDLSRAVQVFGENSGPLFESVTNLGQVTKVLAANDQFVSQFIGDLTSVSSQLSGERDDLAQALDSLAGALKTVRTFVRDNKSLLVSDVKKLTDTVAVLAKEKDSMNTFTRLGALGIQNLNLAFDKKTGTIGSRVQFGPTLDSFDNVLCDIIANSRIPGASEACQLIKTLLGPIKSLIPPLTGIVPPSLAGVSDLFGAPAVPDGLTGLLDTLGQGLGLNSGTTGGGQ